MRCLIAVASVFSGLILAGCVSMGTSSLADRETLAQIKVGQTTQQQVEALLGQPAMAWRTEYAGAHLDWWVYEHAASTINPLEYLFLYGFLMNGLGMYDNRQDLYVFFDVKGIVRELWFQDTSYDMGSPLRPLHLTTSVSRTLVLGGRSDHPVNFANRMEYQY